MREIARLSLPMDARLFIAIGKAVAKHEPKAILVPNPAWFSFVVPEGDDALNLGLPLLGPHCPDWVCRWCAEGKLGLSSLALASWIGGRQTAPEACPRDAGDVRRCCELLVRCPENAQDHTAAVVSALCDLTEEWGQWRAELLAALPYREATV